MYLSPRSGSRAPTPSSGFSHRSFFSLARAMASIQETESHASDKFLALQALVQRWHAAEPPEEEPRHLPEEAPAADSEAPTTQEDPPTPSPEKEAPPWWADPAECAGEWWSEAYCNFVPTQTQPGEQATSAPASSATSAPASSATSAPASSSETSAPAAKTKTHHKRQVSRAELIELQNEEEVARDMNLRWDQRGPLPDMAKRWRGQKFRPNQQRWGNNGGKNKEWWNAFYKVKSRGEAQLREWLRHNPKPVPES